MTTSETIWLVLAVVAVIILPPIIRARRKAYRRFLEEYSEREVCEHLKPALDWLKAHGHRVVRAGQKREGMPLEIHLAPKFRPKELYEELKLAEPVRVSERGVLICFEDECELCPAD